MIEFFNNLCCNLQRKTRFPNPARACQCDEAVLAQILLDLLDLILTPNKGCETGGKIV